MPDIFTISQPPKSTYKADAQISDSSDTKINPSTSDNQTNGTQKTKLTDGYGWGVEMTPMDELRVAEATRIVGSTFNGTTIDPNFWTSTLANNGTASQANGQIVLGSSTTNNGLSILQSVRTARYIGSISNRFRSQIQLGDVGVDNNTRRWGMFDGTDGAYFQLSGTILTARVIKGGSPTTVATLVAPTTNVFS